MQILILGDNPVGVSLTEHLAREKNDITLAGLDAGLLEGLRERLDIRTVCGYPSHPSVLADAGAEDADMLLAVTDDDEINMTACHVAARLFTTPTRICRLRSRAYMEHPELFFHGETRPDVLIHPEQLVTDAIARLLQFPEALQVLDFAGGNVVLVAVRVVQGSPLGGHVLRELPQHMPRDTDGRVAALFRRGRAIIPEGHTVIEEGDEAFFIAAREHIRPLLSALHPADRPSRRVILGGGGKIGGRLAQHIENDCKVRVIEPRMERCQELAEMLNRAVVIYGNAGEREALLQQEIGRADVYCALTNDDATNIMSSLLAKSLGAHRVIALINDASFADLMHGDDIDIAVSPRQITTSSILAHVRRGEVAMAHSLRRGAAEALEVVVHGDRSHSRVVGRSVEELPLPPGASIGAIVRGEEEVRIPHRDTRIENGDHIVLFLADKGRLADVERLFQASFDSF